jgi:hypothetical protein
MIEKAIPSSAASASDIDTVYPKGGKVEAQGVDSGIVECIDSQGSWNSSSDSEVSSSDDETRDNILLDLDPESKVLIENLKQRENAQKLDRKRHLLITKLQHLRKCVNVLVIGPDHAGKTSLINSLGFMIRKDDKGNHQWKPLAEYDLGKSFKYKHTQMWPLDKRNRIANHVTFYEAGGFEKVGDIDKAATILQYALEGRLTACTLLQMFLLMNTNDITERYREDPADPRVLEERRIDAILHVTPAHAPPNEALIKLIAQAVNQSRDPRVKKIPILTCVTQPHSPDSESPVVSPVFPLSDYDLAARVKKSQDGAGHAGAMRRNHSLSKLSMGGGHHIASGAPQSGMNLCEPATCRRTLFYQPEYDLLNDESDISSIKPSKEIDSSLLQLFEDTLRVAQREHPSMRKRFFGFIMDMLNQ